VNDDDTARRAILDAALPDIPFDGWTIDTLRNAARTVGCDEFAVERLFPDGVADFVRLYSRRLVERAVEAADLSPSMRASARIRVLIEAWLDALDPWREAQRRLVVWGMMPGNVSAALRLPFETANAIWWAAGDTSTDFSHHTRRATLAAILAATLLHWLDDESEGRTETRAFVARRLADVGRLTRVGAAPRQAPARLVVFPDPRRLVRRIGRSPG